MVVYHKDSYSQTNCPLSRSHKQLKVKRKSHIHIVESKPNEKQEGKLEI